MLAGLGSALVTVPFLRRLPSAEAASYPTRFVVFFSPNEPINKAHWIPQIGPGGSLASLNPVMAALEPFKSKLVIVGDLKNYIETNHEAIGPMLTGADNKPYGSLGSEWYADGISVDQYIARRIHGPGTHALTLGVRAGGKGPGVISYTGPSQPAQPINDPVQAFQTALGSYTLPPDQAAALRAQDKSVLDVVAGELGRVTPRLSAADRDKLERHLDAVHDLQAALAGAGPPTGACSPSAPMGSYDPAVDADFPLIAALQTDVLVTALSCGVTRVASLQLGTGGGTPQHPVWVSYTSGSNAGEPITDELHSIAHKYWSGPAVGNQPAAKTTAADRAAVEASYYGFFAQLLQKLDAVPEGMGTLLDNTLVLWVKHLGHAHESDQLLHMLAGRAAGALTGGRYYSFPGRSHQDILVESCRLMGLTDVTSFGTAPNLQYCQGPLDLA
jgi:hypothetical protein